MGPFQLDPSRTPAPRVALPAERSESSHPMTRALRESFAQSSSVNCSSRDLRWRAVPVTTRSGRLTLAMTRAPESAQRFGVAVDRTVRL